MFTLDCLDSKWIVINVRHYCDPFHSGTELETSRPEPPPGYSNFQRSLSTSMDHTYDIPRPTSLNTTERVRVADQIYDVLQPTTLNRDELAGVVGQVYDVPRPAARSPNSLSPATHKPSPSEPSTPNNYANVDPDLSPSVSLLPEELLSPQSREHSYYENVKPVNTSSIQEAEFDGMSPASKPQMFTVHYSPTHVREYSNVSVVGEGDLSSPVDGTIEPQGSHHAMCEQSSRIVAGYEWCDGVFGNS